MKERNWNLLHNWEKKNKADFLSKLTIKGSLKILQELHELFQSETSKKEMLKLNSLKVHTLSKIHFAFGKVKI
jgi:hypothetical protein